MEETCSDKTNNGSFSVHSHNGNIYISANYLPLSELSFTSYKQSLITNMVSTHFHKKVRLLYKEFISKET